jgi:hypothetical protein
LLLFFLVMRAALAASRALFARAFLPGGDGEGGGDGGGVDAGGRGAAVVPTAAAAAPPAALASAVAAAAATVAASVAAAAAAVAAGGDVGSDGVSEYAGEVLAVPGRGDGGGPCGCRWSHPACGMAAAGSRIDRMSIGARKPVSPSSLSGCRVDIVSCCLGPMHPNPPGGV